MNGFQHAAIDVRNINIDFSVFASQSGFSSHPYLQVGQSFSVDLPGDSHSNTVTLEIQSLEQPLSEDFFTYTGKVINYRNSSFTLTLHNNFIEGQIVINQDMYTIRHHEIAAGTLHTLTWTDRNLIDSSHFNNDFNIDTTKNMIIPKNLNTKSKREGTIRVLFLYGNDVSNPLYLTSNIVAKMNTVFTNSQINKFKLTVADIEVLNTDFDTKCRYTISIDMLNENPPFSNLTTKVSNTYADMVAVVAKGDVPINCFPSNPKLIGRIGGIAELYDPFGINNENTRYTNFSDNYALGDLTAIHELGHLIGGLHAVQSGGPGDPYPWANNQAIVSLDETEQTIMGGIGGMHPCDFLPPVNGIPQQDCIRIEAFSKTTNNPMFTDGSPAGSSTRNNAAYFKDTTLPDISTYRSDPPPPASAPVLSITDFCYGNNHLAWNTISLANNYEVWRADNASFLNPVRIYNGIINDLSAYFASTAYYRVKACNEGGCSND